MLRHLRTPDDRYRLILFGDDLNAAASKDARRYLERLHRDIADLEPSGTVSQPGHVGDMPDALSDVGVVVSSSVRESFHCGLVVGAASGAVPIVRDWPFFAERNKGARAADSQRDPLATRRSQPRSREMTLRGPIRSPCSMS